MHPTLVDAIKHVVGDSEEDVLEVSLAILDSDINRLPKTECIISNITLEVGLIYNLGFVIISHYFQIRELLNS